MSFFETDHFINPSSLFLTYFLLYFPDVDIPDVHFSFFDLKIIETDILNKFQEDMTTEDGQLLILKALL